MTSATVEHVGLLKDIVRTSPPLMAALHAAQAIGLSSWCIGAGAVRNVVWDHLHGRSHASPLAEVDLVYFDAHKPLEHDRDIQDYLSRKHPDITWDVTNQAHVHLWYERAFGKSVPALQSLEEGVSTWPEYATCVGLYLTVQGELETLAPHGLSDLFALRVRHNPARAGENMFVARHTSKGWTERWPQLQIVSS